jgi:acetate CoA/acetoacetate CoA-transferase alpha subunit
MNKLITIEQAMDFIKDGDTIFVGGFLAVGSPHLLISALVKRGTKNLTLICNDTGFPELGVGKLVVNRQLKKIYTSHIGTNKETGRQMMAGETEVVLVPQGTLIEQIRAAGYGLGGVLTRTGLGTEVAKGKEIVKVDGVDFLLEKPIFADVSLIAAHKGDTFGNLFYHGATRNFNNITASAGKVTIAEVKELVEAGQIDPDIVHTPGVFVNFLVQGGELHG